MRLATLPGWWPVAAAALLQWLPLATASFLPFVDLPQHVAQAQLLLHRSDPAVAALYDVDLVPQVNILALGVLAPALAMLPEAAAVRLLLALYCFGLGWAAYRLARSLGTSAWAAAAVLLFAVQFNLWYGFLSFCLGLPLWLVLVARHAHALDDMSPPRFTARSAIVEILLWWLLVLAHALLFAFALAAFALWMVWARRRPAAQVRWRALVIVPALAWLGAWAIATRRTIASHFGATGGGIDALWDGPAAKLAEAGRALGVATQPGVVEWTVLLLGIAVAAACIRRVSGRGTHAAPVSWLRSIALLALALYVILPYSIYDPERVTYGLFILYPRFAVLAPLVLAVTIPSPSPGRLRRAAVSSIVLALAALCVHWTMVFARVGREAAGLDAAIESLPPLGIVKSLVRMPYPQKLRYEGFLHVASYYQARRLGETDQSFAALLPSPVHYRDPQERPYLSLHDEHLRPDDFDPARAVLYDYILTDRLTPAGTRTWTVLQGGKPGPGR